MIIRIASHHSCNNLIIVIPQRILESHSYIELPQKLLIRISGMHSRSIFPHHLHNPDGFCYPQMLNVAIDIPVSIVYLTDNRHDISRGEIGNGNVAVF